jgi:hypothetical protein
MNRTFALCRSEKTVGVLILIAPHHEPARVSSSAAGCWPDMCAMGDSVMINLIRQCFLFILILIAALLSRLVPESKRAEKQTQ